MLAFAENFMNENSEAGVSHTNVLIGLGALSGIVS